MKAMYIMLPVRIHHAPNIPPSPPPTPPPTPPIRVPVPLFFHRSLDLHTGQTTEELNLVKNNSFLARILFSHFGQLTIDDPFFVKYIARQVI
jgi:hypothetical protein